MRLRIHRAFFISWLILGCYGCANFPMLDTRFNVFGSRELVEPDKVEPVNLIDLLAQHSDKKPGELADLDGALKAFYDKTENREGRRNRIQDRILLASQQRCDAYMRFLNQFDSESSFFLGALTTALAGAATFVTPASAARVFAGTGAVTSGVNAEFAAKFFSQKTIQVLSKGVNGRRDRILDKIHKSRVRIDENGKELGIQGIDKYSVETAIKDALEYHGACSLIAGLEEVADKVDRAQRPGIDEFKKVLADNKEINKLTKEDPKATSSPQQPSNKTGTSAKPSEKTPPQTKP